MKKKDLKGDLKNTPVYRGAVVMVSHPQPVKLHYVALSFPFLKGRGKKKYYEKNSMVETRTQRLLTNYHRGQNRLNVGRLT